MVALCPQRQEFNEAIAEELNLGFPVVQDPNNAIATEFGLTLQTPPKVIEAESFLGLDLPSHNGTDNWNLPIPSRYVLDNCSIVKYATHNIDHRMRSEPHDCLNCMD